MKTSLHRSFTAALAAVTLIFGIGSPQTGFAATRIVNNTNDTGADSLRAQVAASNTGDIITFNASLNGKTIKLASQITITKSITIVGPGWDRLTISGNGKSRIFYVQSTDADPAVIQGVTLTKGTGKGPTPANDVAFVNYGGAIYNNAALKISYCLITNCSVANSGGGGGIYNAGALVMTDSTVSYNQATNGGGIFAAQDMTIERSLIANNKATQDGGGIQERGSTSTLINTTIAGNTATAGSGGGLNSPGATDVDFYNCTVSLNRAKFGGGLSVGNEAQFPSWRLRNTIVAGNGATTAGPDIYNPVAVFPISLGHNLIGNTSGAGGFITGDPPNDDILNPVGGALLGPLQDNNGPTLTMMLYPDSPAIDAGNDALLAVTTGAGSDQGSSPTTDQRGTGYNRILKGRTSLHVDIGAYEYLAPRALKQKALDIIQACLNTNPSQPTLGLLTTAKNEIILSLTNAYWMPTGALPIDDSRLTPCKPVSANSGENVFDHEAEAAAALVEVWCGNSACADAAHDALVALVMADELLARTAIKDAQNDHRRAKYARRELCKALEALAKGKYVRSIEYFKQAWSEAVCGETCPPGDTDSDDDDDGDDH